MNCGCSMFRTINYRTLFLTRTVKILPISTCNEFSNRRREWSSRLIGPETRMRGRRSASAVEVQGDCQHHAGVLIDFVLVTGGEKRGLSGGGKGHGSGERGEERPEHRYQAGEQSSSNHEPLSGFSCVSLLPPRACGGVVCTCACAARPASRTCGFSALPRTLSAFALVGHGTQRRGTTRFRPTVLSGPRWMNLLRPF